MFDSTSLASIDISTLVPHQGTMCLWQRIVVADANAITVSTTSHRELSNPLRSDEHLRAIHLCEYGAQAMAVHGGLLASMTQAPVRQGFLVALRSVNLYVPCIDNLVGDLIGHAELLMQGDDSQQYSFRIEHAGELIAEGRAAVMLQS